VHEGAFGSVDQQTVVHHPDTALHIVDGVAWERAPGCARGEVPEAGPRVYGDRAVAKIFDCGIESGAELPNGRRVRDQIDTESPRAHRVDELHCCAGELFSGVGDFHDTEDGREVLGVQKGLRLSVVQTRDQDPLPTRAEPRGCPGLRGI